MSNTTNTRRNYKDSIFRMLFSDKESALELFNALEGTDYGPETEIEITTLEDVIYLGVKNDLGFTVDSQLLAYVEKNLVAGHNRNEAIQLAIRRCIKEGILSDFLTKNSTEVENMLYTDITTEEFLEIRTKEAIETGLEQGLEQGFQQGKSEMKEKILKNMKNKGLSDEEIAEMTGLQLEEVLSIYLG